jgi:hypothetical protein
MHSETVYSSLAEMSGQPRSQTSSLLVIRHVSPSLVDNPLQLVTEIATSLLFHRTEQLNQPCTMIYWWNQAPMNHLSNPNKTKNKSVKKMQRNTTERNASKPVNHTD